ncbi:MAG: response regulator [Chloroflexi bacterium]|nr:response regulator [Chloroflexota bacterium]
MINRDSSAQPVEKHAALKTILIVEDDELMGEAFVQAITEETSHLAVLVPDAVQALETVKDHLPDLLILDYHLPRMNGLDLYDRLHAMDGLEHVPTILTSAGVLQYNIGKRRLVGISKPVDLNKLLDLVEELLSP